MAYYSREGAIWDRHRGKKAPHQRDIRDRQVLVQRVITAKGAANELRAADILKDCPWRPPLSAKTIGLPPVRRLVPKMPGAGSGINTRFP
jgi:hypothetical protein